MIDPRESEVFERAGPKGFQYAALRLGRLDGAIRDPLQQRSKLGGVHSDSVRSKAAVLLTFENRPVNNNDLPQ